MALQHLQRKGHFARSCRVCQAQPTVKLHASHSSAATIAATVLAASTLLLSSPSFAEDAPPGRTQAAESSPASTLDSNVASTAGPTSISFTVVNKKVRDALNQRDENMAWKCKGVNMYDCDGSDAEAAEKRWEDFRNSFKSDK